VFRALIQAHRLAGQLWVRVALFAILAILVVLVAHLAAPLVPPTAQERFGPGSVTPVLTILASSMLAVSTFSLGTMVAAHRAAAATATPRVMQLMIADRTTQTVLAVFIGAFVYALTALILFHAGFNGGAPLVLGATLLVVAGVVVALIRWIDHLTTLGTLGDALSRAEAQGRAALIALRRCPALGATPLTEGTVIADEAHSLDAPVSGVLQAIDVAGLEACVPGPVWVLKRPGQVVLRGTPLVRVAGNRKDIDAEAIVRCFVIGNRRTYEQDPALGLTALSEIASRALSPAVNDPGTAIEVIARLERLLWDWAQAEPGCEVRHPAVFVPAWSAADLVEAAFAPTARDGAATLEVARPLIDALNALTHAPDSAIAEAAAAMAQRARDHALAALAIAAEQALLPEAAKPPAPILPTE